jgi:hypothetical protein
MKRGMRLVALIGIVASAALAIATPACTSHDCRADETRCVGDTVYTCVLGDHGGWTSWQEGSECGVRTPGTVCRMGTRAECIYPDRPCAESVCVNGEAVHCGSSGFVTGQEVCEADATCAIIAGGPTNGPRAACVYTAAVCPVGGHDAFCDATGTTIYEGCTEGFGAPTRRATCDPRCVERVNTAVCASL